MDIPGIPASISRTRYVELLAAFGVTDLDGINEITLGVKHIVISKAMKDAEGHLVVDHLTNELVRHRIAIPIVEDDPDPDAQWRDLPGADGPVAVRADVPR